MKPVRLKQQGFALILALFLLVVLAALGGAMATFSSTQHLNSAQDIQGSRAYWAARAGLEWAVVSILADPTRCADPVASPPSSIEGFTIAIRCNATSYQDGPTAILIYRFESIASLGTSGNLGAVERSVSMSIER